MARLAAEAGDDGTNDLLVSDLIRTTEKQVWFVSEHLVDVPLVRATEREGDSMPKMRAAQVVSAKGPYQIVEREIPEPDCGPGAHPRAGLGRLPQ
jgi:hypothetical protein